MSNGFFDDRCRVSRGGYQWVETLVCDGPKGAVLSVSFVRDSPEWVLRQCNPSGSSDSRVYHPLVDHPSLFREFADLPSDLAAILKFANQYGLLGDDREIVFPPQTNAAKMRRKKLQTRDLDVGEPLDVWTRHIGEMKSAVDIWGMCETGNIDGLMKLFLWKDRDEMHREGWFFRNDKETLRPIYDYCTERRDCAFEKDDVLLPAKMWVNGRINEAFADNNTRAALVYDGIKGSQFLKIVPECLLTTMWLQFAQAIVGHKQFRTCRLCGNYFEVSADNDARTKRREFCKESCKSTDYRRRKEQATAMNKKGRPAEVIAKETKTPIETVRGWLRKNRRRRNNEM